MQPATICAFPLDTSALSGALNALAAVLCVCGAWLAFSAVCGRTSRALTRPESGRILAAVAVSALIAAALLVPGCWNLLAETAGTGIGGYILPVAFALGLATVLPALAALIAAAVHYRAHGVAKLIQTAQGIAELFVWWLPRPKNQNSQDGSNGAVDEADFEITMASGEEVEAEAREYIENILELSETTAQEVMTPRTDARAIDLSWPPEKVLATVADSRFSRFPVYEGNTDNVIGILHLRDLFEFLARGEGIEGIQLREMILEPIFVPSSRKVDDILRDLQRKKSHMAIVLDEYGGTAGILTIEDLLEEIVGEIQDEYDEEVKHLHQREDGSWVVSAQINLDDLNDLLATGIESEDFDTLGGFIANSLGRIPKALERVELDNWRFTVLSVASNRIGMVLVEKTPEPGRA